MVKMTAKDWHRFAKAMMPLVILPFIIGAIFAFRTHQFLQHAVPAKAKVIELVRQDTHQGTYFAPVFAFVDANGKEIKVYSKTGSYSPVANVGDNIDVLYELDNPQGAKEKTFINLWGLSLIPAGLGVFYFILFGIVAYFTGRKLRIANQAMHPRPGAGK